jgi:ribonuclease J
MVRLTFHGGVNEIGGNKILLEDDGARILFDFGASFGQSGKYFSEFLQPRKLNGIGDFLEFGLLPDLPGIYRPDYISRIGRKPEPLGCQGLFLSHAHADHASYINHLRCDLPIFCSQETRAILQALNDTASGSFADLTELVRCFETYENTRGEISKKTTRTHPDIVMPRAFNTMAPGAKVRIDSIEVIAYPVDHSLPGATAFVAHTPAGSIAYTGDYRFHGRRGKATDAFIDALSRDRPDVLITEGTRVGEGETRREADVEDDVARFSSPTNGLTVCNWPVRDTDRMLSFLNAAKTMGKKLAISTKQAYLLEKLRGCGSEGVPSLDDPAIEVYAMRKDWGMVGSDCDQRMLYADYEKWERPYLERAVCHADVMKDPKGYLWFCSNFDLKELIDLHPPPGSVYMKSVCEPFDMEMELDWEKVQNWIDHFGLEYGATHVSGHASGPQIGAMIDRIKPRILIPVHTQQAELFKQWQGSAHLLKATGDAFQLNS